MLNSDTVAVFGLGYVGVPLARRCVQQGFTVVGVDIDPAVVNEVNNGVDPTTGQTLETEVARELSATTDGEAATAQADIVVLTVPTPVDGSKHTNLSSLKSALEVIGRGLNRDTLVIIESTIPPGTTEEVIEPILAEAGYECGADYFLAHSPERIDPGNDEWPLEDVPRVVGAMTDDGLDRALAFYRHILQAQVHPASSTGVAEATKTVENAFRDINIAFVNELAKAFDHYPIDVKETIDLAGTKPYGFMPFYPGAGVGGHCIPVDPYFLLNSSKSKGYDQSFLREARNVNESMPHYVVEITSEVVDNLDVTYTPTILLLGVAFKPGLSDTRHSPFYPVRDGLSSVGMDIESFDPYVPKESTVNSPYQDVDVVVLITAHDEFEDIDFNRLADTGVKGVVDGRNEFSQQAVADAGLRYRGVGRGVE